MANRTMADKTYDAAQKVSSAKATGVTDTMKKSDVPSVKRFGEVGYTGLPNEAGRILDESIKDLRFPYSVCTFEQMSKDPIIYSVLAVIRSFIGVLEWDVVPPKDATEEELRRAELIKTMMHDMDRPWSETILEAMTSNVYGFSILEKVFKRRKGFNRRTDWKSSAYNDQLIGWGKLAPRSQDTIDKFIFSEDNRELLGFRQNMDLVPNTIKEYKNDTKVILPRKSCLLFRCNPVRDNPEGNSPLKGAYYAWKFKTTAEEMEAIGFSRDLRGLPVFKAPIEFFSDDATQDQKDFLDEIRRIIRNLQANEEAGILMPTMYDDTGNQLFEFDLTNLQGGRDSAIGEAIKRYENKMLMAFSADILKTGQDSVGSYALADSKTNLLSIGIHARLKEITDVFNKDLIPDTFRRNGWNEDGVRYPRIIHDDLDEFSLEELSKYIQRVVSVNAIEVDKPLSDELRKRVGLGAADPSAPLDDKLVASGESRAGDGMKEGMPSGTGNATGGGDTSSNNSDNKG